MSPQYREDIQDKDSLEVFEKKETIRLKAWLIKVAAICLSFCLATGTIGAVWLATHSQSEVLHSQYFTFLMDMFKTIKILLGLQESTS
jgi:hypothetical protein